MSLKDKIAAMRTNPAPVQEEPAPPVADTPLPHPARIRKRGWPLEEGMTRATKGCSTAKQFATATAQAAKLPNMFLLALGVFATKGDKCRAVALFTFRAENSKDFAPDACPALCSGELSPEQGEALLVSAAKNFGLCRVSDDAEALALLPEGSDPKDADWAAYKVGIADTERLRYWALSPYLGLDEETLASYDPLDDEKLSPAAKAAAGYVEAPDAFAQAAEEPPAEQPAPKARKPRAKKGPEAEGPVDEDLRAAEAAKGAPKAPDKPKGAPNTPKPNGGARKPSAALVSAEELPADGPTADAICRALEAKGAQVPTSVVGGKLFAIKRADGSTLYVHFRKAKNGYTLHGARTPERADAEPLEAKYPKLLAGILKAAAKVA